VRFDLVLAGLAPLAAQFRIGAGWRYPHRLRPISLSPTKVPEKRQGGMIVTPMPGISSISPAVPRP